MSAIVILFSIFGSMGVAYTGYLCYGCYKQKQREQYKERAFYNLEYGMSGLYPQYEFLPAREEST